MARGDLPVIVIVTVVAPVRQAVVVVAAPVATVTVEPARRVEHCVGDEAVTDERRVQRVA